jgi:opacity protein-like surface antigen
MVVQDSDVSNSALLDKVEFDTGFAVGGVFGYKIAQGVRFEGEYTYRRASIDDACFGSSCASGIGGLDADGSVDAHAIMANVFYEPKFGKWLPYVGGGLGIGIVGYDADATIAGTAVSFDDSDSVFAYQVGGGIGYELTENHMVSIGYRYWATTDPELDGADAEVGTHNILAELRTTF